MWCSENKLWTTSFDDVKYPVLIQAPKLSWGKSSVPLIILNDGSVEKMSSKKRLHPPQKQNWVSNEDVKTPLVIPTTNRRKHLSMSNAEQGVFLSATISDLTVC